MIRFSKAFLLVLLGTSCQDLPKIDSPLDEVAQKQAEVTINENVAKELDGTKGAQNKKFKCRAENLDACLLILDQAAKARSKKPSDKNHLILLSEMENDPEQLAMDVYRVDFIKIVAPNVKDKVFVTKTSVEKPEVLISMIAKSLEDHINSYKNSRLNIPGRNNKVGSLDRFSALEIIFPIVQNFSFIPYGKMISDEPEIFKYGGDGDSNALWVEIAYSAWSDAVTVTYNFKKVLHLPGAPGPGKKLWAKFSSKFHLSSGQVDFESSYKLDKKLRKLTPEELKAELLKPALKSKKRK